MYKVDNKIQDTNGSHKVPVPLLERWTRIQYGRSLGTSC